MLVFGEGDCLTSIFRYPLNESYSILLCLCGFPLLHLRAIASLCGGNSGLQKERQLSICLLCGKA